MEITLKLTADQKLETLLDKLCTVLDPAATPVTAMPKPALTQTVTVPVSPTTTAPVITPTKPAAAAPVVAQTVAPTAPAAAPAAQPVVTVPLQSAPVTTTVPTVPTVPVTTTAVPAANAAQQQTVAPTAAPAVYTIEQLQGAVGPLLMGGKGPQLQGLLTKYGVSRLPDLTEDKRGAFAADLRGMGAQI